jgi:hypothetical protein
MDEFFTLPVSPLPLLEDNPVETVGCDRSIFDSPLPELPPVSPILPPETPSPPRRAPPPPPPPPLQLQFFTFNGNLIGSKLESHRELCVKDIKRALTSGFVTSAKRKERLTICIVPESFENVFLPKPLQHSNTSVVVKDEMTLTNSDVKKIHQCMSQVKQILQKRKRVETHETSDEEPSPPPRKRRVRTPAKKPKKQPRQPPKPIVHKPLPPPPPPPPPPPKVLPPMQLTLLIYKRIKQDTKYFPNNKFYAVLHRLVKPTGIKQNCRYTGSIFIPVVQKNIESYWFSMSPEERFRWSLQEDNCPLRVEKFSEVVKFTMQHPPFCDEVPEPTTKDIPSGAKQWYVCHPNLQEFRFSLVECDEAKKIVENKRFHTHDFLYGRLTKGRRIQGQPKIFFLPNPPQWPLRHKN